MLMTQTGYDYDSAVYYRARYYDPTIGRFLLDCLCSRSCL
jgi:hypothetical protein